MADWTMIDWEGHQMRLDRGKVKTAQRPLPVSLVPEVETMLRTRPLRVRTRGRGRAWQDLPQRRRRRLGRGCLQPTLPPMARPVRPSRPHGQGEVGREVVLYLTRHTRNVEMIRDEGGFDLSIASKEMGHANVSTTVRHYLHLTDRDVTDAVRKGKGETPRSNRTAPSWTLIGRAGSVLWVGTIPHVSILRGRHVCAKG